MSGSLKVVEVCDVYPWPHRTLHNTGQTSIVLLGLLIPSTTPTLHIHQKDADWQTRSVTKLPTTDSTDTIELCIVLIAIPLL